MSTRTSTTIETSSKPFAAAQAISPAKKSYVPVALLLAFLAYVLLSAGARSAILVTLGVGLGVAFFKGGIGFTTPWRRLITAKDPSGIFFQAFLLVVGMLLFIPVLAANDTLNAAAGPVSVSLVVGAFFFGFFMQLSDGCGSGILLKTGSGTPRMLLLFAFFATGSFVGSLHVPWWLSLGSLGPVVLYQKTSAWLTLAIQIVLVAILVLVAYARGKNTPKSQWRWNTRAPYVAAFVIAVLSFGILLISGAPWGIVYGPGLWVAQIANSLGAPVAQTAFWSSAAAKQTLENSLLFDITSLTTIGFVLGAWASAYKSRSAVAAIAEAQKKLGRSLDKKTGGAGVGLALGAQAFPTAAVVTTFAAFFAGYFSRPAFGCNIGALYSGIVSSSLHGWIWLVAAFLGTSLSVRLRPYCGLDAK